MDITKFPNNSFYLSSKSNVRNDCEYLLNSYMKNKKIGRGSITHSIYL